MKLEEQRVCLGILLPRGLGWAHSGCLAPGAGERADEGAAGGLLRSGSSLVVVSSHSSHCCAVAARPRRFAGLFKQTGNGVDIPG